MNFLEKTKKHYFDIKKFGIYELLRKIKVLTLEIINILLIIFIVSPLFIVFILISNFVIFRFGIIRSCRVGHFIANTELYLCEKKIQISSPKKIIDIISYDNVGISNLYLSKHYKKKNQNIS